MKFGATCVFVDDVPAVLDFYRRAFGCETHHFDETYQYGELETGETLLAFSSHPLGALVLPGGYQRPDPSGPPLGIYIAFVTPDVPAAFVRAVGAGAVPVGEPRMMPWGRYFRRRREAEAGGRPGPQHRGDARRVMHADGGGGEAASLPPVHVITAVAARSRREGVVTVGVCAAGVTGATDRGGAVGAAMAGEAPPREAARGGSEEEEATLCFLVPPRADDLLWKPGPRCHDTLVGVGEEKVSWHRETGADPGAIVGRSRRPSGGRTGHGASGVGAGGGRGSAGEPAGASGRSGAGTTRSTPGTGRTARRVGCTPGRDGTAGAGRSVYPHAHAIRKARGTTVASPLLVVSVDPLTRWRRG
jgi:lactoylglutathione lyase